MPTYISDPLAHAQALIKCPSVTPDQAGALDYLESIRLDGGRSVVVVPIDPNEKLAPGTLDLDRYRFSPRRRPGKATT